ncbi:hypothetical protein BVC80_27g8 [Macleaya cordata]|uniref:TSL-kinase interacting protein 1 n=1 Tax=Macleaya cordata TaxID=56857 RepID=A0A200QFK1_MACCD|nr:hypothetical protein BVC80_27g8 [Macleaya cordata]
MKTARKQRQASANTGIGYTRSKIPTTRTGGKRRKSTADLQNLSGQNDSSSIGKDKSLLPSPTVQSLTEKLQVKGTCCPEKTNDVPRLELGLGQMPQSYNKIKLQLFPIDEVTRIRLEKDGHNPYLELILSERKKISSVLKHLTSKWGSSSTAVGELMLFPYNIRLENLAGHKSWTLKDRDISAADVYEATGRPSIFRLRYGWFSHLDPKTYCIPRTSSCFEDGLQSENLKKDCTVDGEIRDIQTTPNDVDNREDREISISITPNAIVGGIMSLVPAAAEPPDNSRIGDRLTLSSCLWADSLTNISIGGLLSETSLHAAASRGDAKPAGTDSCLQQIPFSSDSFDAAIAAHICGHPQGAQQRSISHSSILDAEETCHAFAFQKLSSLEKVLNSSKAATGSHSQDVNSNSFKFPNSVEGHHAEIKPSSILLLKGKRP